MNDPRFPRVNLQGFMAPDDPPQRIPNLPQTVTAQIPRPTGGVAPSGPGGVTPSAMPIYDPHHYARVADLSTPVPEVSQLLLEHPPTLRNYLMIRNDSGTGGPNIFISFGNNASIHSTLRLEPNQIAFFDVVVPQDDIYMIADGAGAQLSYAFSNIAA